MHISLKKSMSREIKETFPPDGGQVPRSAASTSTQQVPVGMQTMQSTGPITAAPGMPYNPYGTAVQAAVPEVAAMMMPPYMGGGTTISQQGITTGM